MANMGVSIENFSCRLTIEVLFLVHRCCQAESAATGCQKKSTVASKRRFLPLFSSRIDCDPGMLNARNWPAQLNPRGYFQKVFPPAWNRRRHFFPSPAERFFLKLSSAWTKQIVIVASIRTKCRHDERLERERNLPFSRHA
jgi:hypothetical protein